MSYMWESCFNPMNGMVATIIGQKLPYQNYDQIKSFLEILTCKHSLIVYLSQ